MHSNVYCHVLTLHSWNSKGLSANISVQILAVRLSHCQFLVPMQSLQLEDVHLSAGALDVDPFP